MPVLLLFIGFFAFYLTGASPALDGGDAGEFIASTATLGIPHAPGYPLFQLIGKIPQILIPWASIAYRCHVLSALSAALLVVLVFHISRSWLEEHPHALWAALALAIYFGTRPLVVEQARVFEVFLLNAVFVLGIVISLERGNVFLAAFLFGLGLGNHQTIVFAAPLFLPYLRSSRPVVLSSLLFFFIGFSVYAYLPIRAHMNPPVNFGDPETLGRFWAVLTRKEFGSLSLHPSALAFRNIDVLSVQLLRFFERAFRHTGVVALALMTAGAAIGWRNPLMKKRTVLLVIGWIGVGLGFELLSNLSPLSDIGQWRLERFYLLPLIFSLLLVLPTFQKRVWLAAVLLVALPLSLVSSAAPNFRWNLSFRDFALSVLRNAPKDSCLVIDRVLFDEPTSAMLVTTQVEKKRPDIKFFYRPGTLFEPIYGTDVLELPWDQRFQRQRHVEERLSRITTPVCFFGFDKANAPFPDPMLRGLLYFQNQVDSARGGDGGGVSRSGPLFRADYSTRLIEAHRPYFLGKAALEMGDMEAAEKLFQWALFKSGDMTWLLCNIGGLYAQRDLIDRAARCFETAVRQDPYFFEAQYGQGFVFVKQNKLADAVRSFEQATRLAPARAEGFYMLGLVHRMNNNAPSARAAWGRYLELEPRGNMAQIIREEMSQWK